jgi:hypothetical protein
MESSIAMTDVVLGIMMEELGEEVTLSGEDDGKRSIGGLVIITIGIRRTIVVWRKTTVGERNPFRRIHRRVGLRMKKRKASKYRKAKKH